MDACPLEVGVSWLIPEARGTLIDPMPIDTSVWEMEDSNIGVWWAATRRGAFRLTRIWKPLQRMRVGCERYLFIYSPFHHASYGNVLKFCQFHENFAAIVFTYFISVETQWGRAQGFNVG